MENGLLAKSSVTEGCNFMREYSPSRRKGQYEWTEKNDIKLSQKKVEFTKWTNGHQKISENIKQYGQIIKTSRKIKLMQAYKRDKWFNDFIDGKPVKQFDKFVHSVE